MRGLLGLVFIVVSVAAGARHPLQPMQPMKSPTPTGRTPAIPTGRTPAIAQVDSYLCIADQSTGFAFDKSTEQWSAKNFNVSENKYIVRRIRTEESVFLDWQGEIPEIICRQRINVRSLTCDESNHADFFFSAKTMRYMKVSAFGYLVPFDQVGDDTPFIEIGKCSPL